MTIEMKLKKRRSHVDSTSKVEVGDNILAIKKIIENPKKFGLKLQNDDAGGNTDIALFNSLSTEKWLESLYIDTSHMNKDDLYSLDEYFHDRFLSKSKVEITGVPKSSALYVITAFRNKIIRQYVNQGNTEVKVTSPFNCTALNHNSLVVHYMKSSHFDRTLEVGKHIFQKPVEFKFSLYSINDSEIHCKESVINLPVSLTDSQIHFYSSFDEPSTVYNPSYSILRSKLYAYQEETYDKLENLMRTKVAEFVLEGCVNNGNELYLMNGDEIKRSVVLPSLSATDNDDPHMGSKPMWGGGNNEG